MEQSLEHLILHDTLQNIMLSHVQVRGVVKHARLKLCSSSTNAVLGTAVRTNSTLQSVQK